MAVRPEKNNSKYKKAKTQQASRSVHVSNIQPSVNLNDSNNNSCTSTERSLTHSSVIDIEYSCLAREIIRQQSNEDINSQNPSDNADTCNPHVQIPSMQDSTANTNSWTMHQTFPVKLFSV